MEWSIEKKTGTGLAVAGMILLLVAVLLYRNGRSFIEASKWVSHTHEALAELEATLSAVSEAQTAARGYLITDQEAFRETQQATVPVVHAHLQRLKFLISDNPNQRRRVALLESTVAETLDSLQQNVDLRRQKGFEAAQRQVANGIGTEQMNRVRTVVSEMKQEEEDLLKRRDREFQVSTQETSLTLSCVVLLGFLQLGLVYFVLLRDITAQAGGRVVTRERRATPQIV
jgi:CHASE3 domain sensor protein